MGKILVVDDDNVIRNVLKKFLEQANYEVDLAEGGIKAIEMIKNTEYDVILLDIIMEDLDGIEVLRKAKKLSPLTTVIMMTAYSSPDYVLHALTLGATDFIEKPFEPEQMLQIVKENVKRVKRWKSSLGLL
ncbi:Response regulator receiver domain-containing protein [Marinitoga hydrogenitolerans DSM 16785]|uniref:Response regulator receiver domain-containing protein n=1 Tax=Marinitoga hydrogenitolerans (strain DSM 16785 / JCM 12826 / AT1271) TaxID=1122195 RepID=A0A1M4UII2_MARH1|nr:response regulator [Marinitoga hydrogenitolerans]SHE56509.1 Response regulator receiver domain-containing protein [Marinitoga hydrogenitolerans DSM 16785]